MTIRIRFLLREKKKTNSNEPRYYSAENFIKSSETSHFKHRRSLENPRRFWTRQKAKSGTSISSWWPNHRGQACPGLKRHGGDVDCYYIRRQAWRYRKVTSLFSHRAVAVFSSWSAVYPAPVTDDNGAQRGRLATLLDPRTTRDNWV